MKLIKCEQFKVVACDGLHLVPFAADLVDVLELTLTLKCKEAAELSGTLLKNVLRAMSSIYATDYRSTSRNFDSPISKQLPIRVSCFSDFIYITKLVINLHLCLFNQ